MTDIHSTRTGAANDQAHQVASVAADRSKDVAGSAKEQAHQVAEAAREQTSEVASQASAQAGQVVDDLKTHLRQQAQDQTSHAGRALDTLAGQFRALSEGRPADAGPLAGVVRQATEKVEGAASRIHEGGFEGVGSDIQHFARRRPVVFLAGAVTVGFAVGRLARAGKESGALAGSPDTNGDVARLPGNSAAQTGADAWPAPYPSTGGLPDTGSELPPGGFSDEASREGLR